MSSLSQGKNSLVERVNQRNDKSRVRMITSRTDMLNMLNDGLFGNEIKSAQLGPVVQSIVSLTSSLRRQLVKCFMTL